MVDNLPFIVRRDQQIVAAFVRQQPAIDWAELRSFNDESRFAEVFQNGETRQRAVASCLCPPRKAVAAMRR